MASLNRVILIGNLGNDPEIRYTQNQTAVCNFSLATTCVRTADDGAKIESTEWHRVVIWGKSAENAAKYLKKGRSICVEGRLVTRSWDASDGTKKYSTEVVSSQLIYLSNKEKDKDQTIDDIPF